MAKKDSKNGGICRLYQADLHSHIIFAATYMATTDNPDEPLTEIVKRVAHAFKIEITQEAALRIYYRMLNAYIENGGA